MGSDLASRIHSPMGAAYSGVAYWSVSAVNGRAEHVCSAQVFQTSTCSAIAEGIIHLNAKVSDGAFDLGMAEQELHSP